MISIISNNNFSLKLSFFILLILPFLNVLSCTELDLIVKLRNGNELLGLKQSSLYSEKPFVEFRGIPYGKALRFKAPQKYEEKWESVRPALEYGAVCPQVDLSDQAEDSHIEDVNVIGDENCLFINIVTPSINPGEKKYPVAIWIHGGSFQFESGDAYGPRKFLEHEIVLVTFNFRLGVLGFANTGDGLIQGNFGLKDQVLALQWVQENIEKFGGDPNSVTLIGTNAGAISAHLHTISPLSEGLFHRAYLQSGSALAPWAITRNSSKTMEIFAKYMKCGNVTLVDCLTDADFKTIITKQPRLTEWFIDPLVPFGPSIETEGNEPKFLSEDPYSILSSGNFWAKDKVPLIMGINSDEGLLHSVDIVHHKMLNKILNMEWGRALPITLMLRDTTKLSDLRKVSDSIKMFYFKDLMKENPGPKELPFYFIGQDFYKFEELTNMYSDRYFNIPIHHTAKLHGKYGSDVFLYWFDYLGTQSSTQQSGYNQTIFGVSHFDQVQYMFNTPYFDELTTPEDIQFGRNYVSKIIKFIVEGKPPSGEWVKVTPQMVEGKVPLIYNRIGHPKDAYQLIEKFANRIEFWDTLPIQEYGKVIESNLDNDLAKSSETSSTEANTKNDSSNKKNDKIEL